MKLKCHYEQYEYLYDSEEEKMMHKKEMEEEGFEDSGRSMFIVNYSLQNPKHEWYGKYFRYLDE